MDHGAEKVPWTRSAPLLLVWYAILFIYVVYIVCHAVPLLQTSRDADSRYSPDVTEGIVCLCLIHFFMLLLAVSYYRCVKTAPGAIPDSPDWRFDEVAHDGGRQQPDSRKFEEEKRGGGKRHCKWCAKFKPDRCHHCRLCRTCVLKMDHHCPWVQNCIGYHNHKFFYLILLYSTAALHMVIWTMLPSVSASMEKEEDAVEMFFLLHAESLAMFLACILTPFFTFHTWLVFQATTTIELCEAKTRKGTGGEALPMAKYNRGVFKNVCDALGSNPLFWFIPISTTNGDGVDFAEALLAGQGKAPSYSGEARSEGMQPVV